MSDTTRDHREREAAYQCLREDERIARRRFRDTFAAPAEDPIASESDRQAERLTESRTRTPAMAKRAAASPTKDYLSLPIAQSNADF